jgi:hypothetical protein
VIGRVNLAFLAVALVTFAITLRIARRSEIELQSDGVSNKSQ